MKMFIVNFPTLKQNFNSIAIIVLILILSTNCIKCQTEKGVLDTGILNRPGNNISITPIIVVVTDVNEKGPNCDERKPETKQTQLFSGNLKR